ncbi:MAG: helix-turn-helix transcriptional regulator [Verrucomicrobia bacterium]|nr:helix-turn-helix transcriptional regulator [Verrucomicrobiota bacterium]MCH8512119.1 helix-turn-helix domain-containing protein [Kiritimatiellia bacterium]
MTDAYEPRSPVLRQADWASLTFSLQWVYESEVPFDGRGPRSNPDLAAWLLLHGTASVRVDGQRPVDANAGDWLFLPAGDRIQDFSEDARILSLCWRAKWPDGRNLFDQGLPMVISSEAQPELTTAARKLLFFSESRLQDVPMPTWRLRASARLDGDGFFEGEILLLQWIRMVMGGLAARGVVPSLHDIPDDRVLQALEHIEFLPLHRALSVEKLAGKVGLSTSQLNRLFSRHVGHTPKAHLHLRRISEAKHLLQSGDMPIKEVSFQLGFASQSAFSHWFTKEVGCNPKTYARRPLPPVG